MKTLLILAAMAAVIALACAGQAPAPAQPLTQLPTTTPMPTPVPPAAATPLPENVGICYRTPEVQEWIIQQLQIPSCRLITEPELYRIQDEFSVSAALKPGDMAGFANVAAVHIPAAHCGDWENSTYAASILDGLNPDAALFIAIPVAHNRDDWPRSEIISFGMHNTVTYPAAVRKQFDDGLVDSGLTDTQISSLLKQGEGLKMRVNTQARSIAAAVAAAKGEVRPLIQIKNLGHAVIGQPPEPGSVSATVTLERPRDIPDCREE